MGGLIAGFATLVEFVFAPPAIAMAIGSYLNVQFPALYPKLVAVGAYVVFMTLNILGVSIAATFELFVTLLAIFELLVFMGVVAPGFSVANFVAGGWSGSDSFSLAAIPGIFAAIPFAIWFFLAIEGVAPHYQIEVRREGALDELEVRVEATEGIFFDQMWKQQEMKQRIEHKLETSLAVHAKVRLVEPGHTPRSEGKAVRVIDKRKKSG